MILHGASGPTRKPHRAPFQRRGSQIKRIDQLPILVGETAVELAEGPIAPLFYPPGQLVSLIRLGCIALAQEPSG